MSGDESRRRGRSGHLSAEDRALWEHVARSVQPVRRVRGRVPELGDKETAELVSDLKQRLKSDMSAGPGTSESPWPMPVKAPEKAVFHAPHERLPPLVEIDRRSARRVRSGRIEIEARIDLHGMRQHEAHGALRGFLIGCQGRGLRWVLVITGKGRFGRSVWSDSDARETPSSYDQEEPGVLRRAVPRWLAEPELRPIVISYTTAASHHGGEGALYVQLRARRDSPHGR